MTDNFELAQSFLSAEGWQVKARGRDLLRGARDSQRGDDEKDYLYVWIPGESGSNLRSREGPYLRRFEEAKEDHPTSEMVFLVGTPEGLTPEFRKGARQWHGVKVLAPAQFFDRALRWESDSRAASATSELRNRGSKTADTRIAQPFRFVQSPVEGDNGTSPDLLEVLKARLRSRPVDDQPTIHIIIGPAGMGKSILFESLYARLFDDFQADKRARYLSARPFALLPEHLEEASAPTIRSLLDAYLRTEFGGPMDRDVFNWKLTNGLGIWMLDGLDEILERDPHFFDDLEDLMTMPSGNTLPSIVLCVRDSLFATHRGLRDFCDELRDYVVVYKLDGWQRLSKEALAKNQLRSKARAKEFVQFLEKQPALDQLACTPYYCMLLREEFETDGLGTEVSETDLLDRAVGRIVRRERAKELLSGIPDEEVRDFLESCAATGLLEGGIKTDDVREMAEVVTPEHLGDDERDRLVTQMCQVALFANDDEDDDRLGFAQEPFEHYLAAMYFARGVTSGAQNWSRRDLPENVIRLMSDCIDVDKRDEVWSRLTDEMREDSTRGRNALRLAVRMSVGTDRLSGMRLADLSLVGMGFDSHNLSGIVLDRSDITNVNFQGSDLSSASLRNCLIKGTRLDADGSMLMTMAFGDLHRFHSAYLGDRLVDDVQTFAQAIGLHTRSSKERHGACQAAQQLRHLFGKYVEETGRGRRKDLSRQALLRGKQIVSNREDLLDEAIRSGYLEERSTRDRIGRAEDESYREIVAFRRDLRMSPGIRALLNEVCETAECSHVY